MITPRPTLGLRHVALCVQALEACAKFYTTCLGMTIVWQPDADNIYLSTGHDNLALHRAPADFNPQTSQRLDHFGFFIETADQVNAWHDYLVAQGVPIAKAPKAHRDGTRSFYCSDPDGNVIQMIYCPPPHSRDDA